MIALVFPIGEKLSLGCLLLGIILTHELSPSNWRVTTVHQSFDSSIRLKQAYRKGNDRTFGSIFTVSGKSREPETKLLYGLLSLTPF